jgi:hypothetical protein
MTDPRIGDAPLSRSVEYLALDPQRFGLAAVVFTSGTIAVERRDSCRA